MGTAIDYLRSRKFLTTDGGHKRLVWMPKEIKEELKDAIPSDLYEKIATEEDVSSIDELSEVLQRVSHPCMA